MKVFLKYILQRLLGIENYLFLFAIFCITRIRLHLQDREFRYFLQLIPENGIVLDIGANIGILSVPLARRVRKGKVFSFEPMPRNLRALRRTVAHYRLNHIEIVETALGNENKPVLMVMPVIYRVLFQGFSHVVETAADENKGELVTVNMQRLDDVAPLQGTDKIHAIKIDVENFEYQVLSGASALLRKHRPVIYCELWDNEKRNKTIDWLVSDFNYEVRVLEKKKLAPFNGQNVFNFFFIPPAD